MINYTSSGKFMIAGLIAGLINLNNQISLSTAFL